jgi:enterochelin esterase family protein
MKKNIPERLRSEGNPLIDGTQVTFYWQGDWAPLLFDEFHGWGDEDGLTLKRVPARLAPGVEKPLWSTSFTLPRGAYLEYIFYDPGADANLPDPFNPRTTGNGMGGRNHFFYMPGAAPTPLALRRSSVKHGTMTRFMADTWLLADDGQREVHLYRPPARERVPLLVVYDGMDYLQRGRLVNIVDNLIAEKRIRPLAMALLQNGGRRRSVEYACSDATIGWLDRVILPLAKENLNLLSIRRNPGAYGVLGASFGALMSLYTGLRMPETFGRVLCQSGSFESDGRDFAAVDLVCHGQAHDRLKIWMDVGRLDSLLEENRRVQSILKKNGYEVTYREFSGGHNYAAWRDDVWRGLVALFPA